MTHSPLNGTRKVLNKHKCGVRSTEYVLFAPETYPQRHTQTSQMSDALEFYFNLS